MIDTTTLARRYSAVAELGTQQLLLRVSGQWRDWVWRVIGSLNASLSACRGESAWCLCAGQAERTSCTSSCRDVVPVLA